MPHHKGGHLNFEDRCDIATFLAERKPLSVIADRLDVSISTISREIRRNRECTGYRRRSYQMRCMHYLNCELTGLCGKSDCSYVCRNCPKRMCRAGKCADFSEYICPKVAKAPYCCNGCTRKSDCRLKQYFYRPKQAQFKAEERLTKPRSGISLSFESLLPTVSIVSELLAKGQSLSHIWRTHGDSFGISERSFYRYMENGYFDMNFFMMPNRVRYKKRKSKKVFQTPKDISGRNYTDFLALSGQKRQDVVQVDCIEGFKRESPAILTLHFVRFNFQLLLLLPHQSAQWVTKAFDALEVLCEGTFSTHFGLILADRGTEFIDYRHLERSRNGSKRCSVYYCDPQRSDQKGSCEKNHVEIRKILPKGQSRFSLLTPDDMADITSHINSYTRASLGGKTPLSLAGQILPESLLEGLGIRHIDPDDVCLTPQLLKLNER